MNLDFEEVEKRGKLSSFLDNLRDSVQCKTGTDENRTKEEKENVTNGTDESGNRNNGISIALKLIGIIEIVGGIISALSLFEDEFWLGLGILVGAMVTGMLIVGIGEIIQKLQNIEDNTIKK